MSKLTPKQIAQILEMPLGKSYTIADPVVLAERKKISEKYDEFFHLQDADLEARTWWIEENLLDLGRPVEATEDY